MHEKKKKTNNSGQQRAGRWDIGPSSTKLTSLVQDPIVPPFDGRNQQKSQHVIIQDGDNQKTDLVASITLSSTKEEALQGGKSNSRGSSLAKYNSTSPADIGKDTLSPTEKAGSSSEMTWSPAKGTTRAQVRINRRKIVAIHW